MDEKDSVDADGPGSRHPSDRSALKASKRLLAPAEMASDQEHPTSAAHHSMETRQGAPNQGAKPLRPVNEMPGHGDYLLSQYFDRGGDVRHLEEDLERWNIEEQEKISQYRLRAGTAESDAGLSKIRQAYSAGRLRLLENMKAAQRDAEQLRAGCLACGIDVDGLSTMHAPMYPVDDELIEGVARMFEVSDWVDRVEAPANMPTVGEELRRSGSNASTLRDYRPTTPENVTRAGLPSSETPGLAASSPSPRCGSSGTTPQTPHVKGCSPSDLAFMLREQLESPLAHRASGVKGKSIDDGRMLLHHWEPVPTTFLTTINAGLSSTDPHDRKNLTDTPDPRRPEQAGRDVNSLFVHELTPAVMSETFQVPSNPPKFFVVGAVFKTLQPLPADDAGNLAGQPTTHSTEMQRFYSRIRRFVVVREGDGYCNALPIVTHANQGPGKDGFNKAEHSIIFSETDEPQPMPNERGCSSDIKGGMLPMAIRVEPALCEKLKPISRANYGMTTTIKHDARVRRVGKVALTSIQHLLDQWYHVQSHVVLPSPSPQPPTFGGFVKIELASTILAEETGMPENIARLTVEKHLRNHASRPSAHTDAMRSLRPNG